MGDVIHVNFKRKKKLATFKEPYKQALLRQNKELISKHINEILKIIPRICGSSRRLNNYNKFLKTLKDELDREENT